MLNLSYINKMRKHQSPGNENGKPPNRGTVLYEGEKDFSPSNEPQRPSTSRVS